jgi:hypothetical protein
MELYFVVISCVTHKEINCLLVDCGGYLNGVNHCINYLLLNH